jgi:PAS domain S-box-containing protein
VTGADDHARGIEPALLTSVLELTADGILVADAAGTIVYTNRPLLELFAYKEDDLLGMPVECLIPRDARRSHRAHVKSFGKSPRPRPMGRDDLDIEGERADGSRFPVDVQLSPLPGVSLVVATVRDMTEQRQLTADRALRTIELTSARAENDRLRLALDLIVQRLFGLGIALNAGAADDRTVTERLEAAVSGIDEIIDGVQRIRND